ncbi:MAG: pyridoxamine 5-phosphate oxidase [Armatimonadetes bacterium]|nr:pyridoxamine 5-phosphate oxidase [Armatimonadota bacterium]
MARWQDVVDSAPEFAAKVQTLFEAGRHKTLATLRKDGSPRISGIECQFKDGDLWIGSGKSNRKAADLRRDPRLALHGPCPDPPDDPLAWPGDAKMSGRAVLVEKPRAADEPEADHFRIDISEVVLTRVGGMDHLVVALWRPLAGLEETKVYN